jgi:hypothetical protein
MLITLELDLRGCQNRNSIFAYLSYQSWPSLHQTHQKVSFELTQFHNIYKLCNAALFVHAVQLANAPYQNRRMTTSYNFTAPTELVGRNQRRRMLDLNTYNNSRLQCAPRTPLLV